MKSPRRILPKPQFKLQNILQRLLKEPILYTEFLDLLKDELKTNSFKNIFKKSFSPYEFNIYEVDNVYKLYIIYIYEIDKEIFIIDKKGLLFEKLIQNFDKTILVEYQNKDILDLNLNFSLVKNNGLRNYFKLASS